MKYIGWIKAHRRAKPRLQELGVKGLMVYDKSQGVFTHCEIDQETMERLIEQFPGFWRRAFSPKPEGREEIHAYFDELQAEAVKAVEWQLQSLQQTFDQNRRAIYEERAVKLEMFKAQRKTALALLEGTPE